VASAALLSTVVHLWSQGANSTVEAFLP